VLRRRHDQQGAALQQILKVARGADGAAQRDFGEEDPVLVRRVDAFDNLRLTRPEQGVLAARWPLDPTAEKARGAGVKA
jgi:hypothetical protein